MDSKCCSEKTSHRLPRHSSLGDGRKGKTFLEGVEEEKSSEKLRLLEEEKSSEKLRLLKRKKRAEGVRLRSAEESVYRGECLRKGVQV